MPHILDAAIPEVNPTGAPGGDFEQIRSSPEAFGGFGAQAEEKFGAGLEKAGNTGLGLATEYQTSVNDIHAAQLQTGYARESTDLFTKYDGLQGAAKMSALPQFKEDLGKLRDKWLGAAPSIQEKTRLAPALSGLEDKYYWYATTGAAHAQTQYAREVAIDKQQMHGGQALLSWSQNDPQGFYNEVANAAQETRNEKEAAGLDPDSIETEAKKTRGVYVREAIKMSIAQGDPHNVAGELAEKYKGLVDPASMVQINGLLNQHRDQKLGDQVAQKAITAASTAPPVGGKPAATGVPVSYLSAIQKEEGFDPVPKWDVKQWTVGYGTKASGPNERPNKEQLDARFHSEIGNAAKIVDGVNPNLDPGTKAALTSLTYNTGDGWTRSGLGAAIKSGDLAAAQKSFLQYSNVAGMFSPAIAQRREREASWFGQPEAPEGSGPKGTSNLKSSAYQVAMSDPDLQGNPAAMQHALTRINQAYTAAQIASDQDIKAKKDANDKSADTFVTRMLKGDSKNIVDDIANDPNLTWETRRTLGEAAQKHAGDDVEGATATYGKGFWGAYKGVVAPDGDPAKINDVGALLNRAGPGGDLTLAGVEKLMGEMKAAKSPEGASESEMRKQFLVNARGKITGTNENLHMRDRMGDELFLKFMAHALPAYDAGRSKGLTPAQLLNPESKDYVGAGMKQFIRPDTEWFSDVMADNPPPPPPAATPGFDVKSLHDLPSTVTAYKSGKITKAQAEQIAIDNGWAARRAPSTAPTVPLSR